MVRRPLGCRAGAPSASPTPGAGRAFVPIALTPITTNLPPETTRFPPGQGPFHYVIRLKSPIYSYPSVSPFHGERSFHAFKAAHKGPPKLHRKSLQPFVQRQPAHRTNDAPRGAAGLCTDRGPAVKIAPDDKFGIFLGLRQANGTLMSRTSAQTLGTD